MRSGQVLVVRHAGRAAVRAAEVVEVLGANAGPPFRVRWLDTGRTFLLHPDSDVWTVPRTHRGVAMQRGDRWLRCGRTKVPAATDLRPFHPSCGAAQAGSGTSLRRSS